MAQTIEYYADEMLKLEQMWALDATRFISSLWRLITRSELMGKNFSASFDLPTGGKAVEFKIVEGYGASAGLPAGLDISKLGLRGEDPDNSVRITTFFMYARSVLQDYEMTHIKNLPKGQLYYDRLSLRLMGIYNVLIHQMTAAMWGDGKYGAVSKTTGPTTINSPTTVFNIPVKRVDHVPVNMDIVFRASNGAVIANAVPGVCIGYDDKTHGAGSIKVVFPTQDDSFTIPTDALLTPLNCADPSNTDNLLFLNGMKEMFGTGAHPRNEGNNVPLDMAQYKAQVINTNGKITYKHLKAMLRRVAENATIRKVNTDPQQTKFTLRDGELASKMAFIMNGRSVDQLTQDLYQGKYDVSETAGARGISRPTVSDEGFIYTEFSGVPIVEDLSCPYEDAYLLHTDALGRYELKPFGPLAGANQVDFAHIPGTIQYELIRSCAHAWVPVFRDCLAALFGSGPLGVDDEDLVGG